MENPGGDIQNIMQHQDTTTKSGIDGAQPLEWYAVRAGNDARTAECLAGECDDVYFPTETVRRPDGKTRTKAVIPHVLFIRTSRSKALALEAGSRKGLLPSGLIWIYRYPQTTEIQAIPERSVNLLRLLTSDDTTRCAVYTARSFTPGQRVRVTDGIYKGYEGFVKRIARNRHVIVNIEGLCMVILPFIHPDLLEPIN